MTDALNKIAEGVTNVGNALWQNLSVIGSATQQGLTNITTGIVNTVSGIGQAVGNALSGVAQWLSNAIQGVANTIGGWADALIKMGEVIVKFGELVFNTIRDIANAIWNGITSAFNFLMSSISRLFEFITNITVSLPSFDGLISMIRNLVSTPIVGSSEIAERYFSYVEDGTQIAGDPAFPALALLALVGIPGLSLVGALAQRRHEEGYMTFIAAFVSIALIYIVQFIAVVTVAAMGEINLFVVKVKVDKIADWIIESIGESFGEAMSEFIDWLFINPLSNTVRAWYGGEWMDDDEVKDVASTGLFSPETVAYWGVRSGLTNSAAVGETATGFAYSAEADARYLQSHLFNTLFEAIEAETRIFRRLLEEADTKTLDALRWSSRVYDRMFSLLQSEAKKLYNSIRDYRKLYQEWENIKDDPTFTESEKNTIANMLNRLESEIPHLYAELIEFGVKLRNVADEVARQIGEWVKPILDQRNRIVQRYEKQIQNRASTIVDGIEKIHRDLLSEVQRIIDTTYALRHQSAHKSRWRMIEEVR